MLDTVTTIVVVILGVHALLKFAFFFILPYRQRRAALDKTYGAKPSATKVADAVFLAFTIALSILILWRGMEAISFLAGLWIGATLIQLFFHRFHDPLSPEEAPPPVVSPIKTLSYAIQARPSRAWAEMLGMTVLIVWAVGKIGASLI